MPRRNQKVTTGRTNPPQPSKLQDKLATFGGNVWASLVAAAIWAALTGVVVTLTVQQLIIGFAVSALLGWVGSAIWQKTVLWARAAVDAWEWRSWKAVVFTFESAEVSITDAGVKLSVVLRVTNVSPIAWSIRGGRIEVVRVGDGTANIQELRLSNAGSGEVYLDSVGQYELLTFSGQVPTFTVKNYTLFTDVVIGCSAHNPDYMAAGFVSVQPIAETYVEPEYELNHMIGVAKVIDRRTPTQRVSEDEEQKSLERA